jgi:hypothetical protein
MQNLQSAGGGGGTTYVEKCLCLQEQVCLLETALQLHPCMNLLVLRSQTFPVTNLRSVITLVGFPTDAKLLFSKLLASRAASYSVNIGGKTDGA